ncbi:MAG: hypothetical protein JRJ64_15880 [Deltaproteobacteria bacterium]|nr:hypothetical protein [Deltaproteobacteria bacterium]
MPLAVDDGEGLFFLDLPLAERAHVECVQCDLLALRELGGMAERRVQRCRSHAESIVTPPRWTHDEIERVPETSDAI